MAGGGRAPSEQGAPDGLRPGDNGPARRHPAGHEQVSDIQRARILAAMVEVVAGHGAANVTVAHVVARSGVSRRTFYELFEDREDCFLAAFDQALERVAAVVLPAYEDAGPWRAKIRAALTALLELLDCEPGIGRLLVVETLGAGPRALERRRKVLAQIFPVVEEGRTEGRRGDGPPPLTAEGVVGGVLSVLHSRLLACPPPVMGGPPIGDPPPPSAARGPDMVSPPPLEGSLLGLAGPLTSMIVLPYLGQVAAQKELRRPVPERRRPAHAVSAADPLRDVDMRLTYRTVRVLAAIAALCGRGSYPSNREVGVAAGMQDQGQISKLLSRLHKLGLIENTGAGLARGAPNAWVLTEKGTEIERAIGEGARR
jgi:AcrR family transcriptional regulator